MTKKWARDFKDIPITLNVRPDLRARMHQCLEDHMPGKALSGGDRSDQLRVILRELIDGRFTLGDAIAEVGRRLPREKSLYRDDNRVFARGWEERAVRTQLSVLYNRSVLQELRNDGHTRCFVHHSSDEHRESPCSRLLAGLEHDIDQLHQKLEDNYIREQWSRDPKIPDHPHCTHVVSPLPVPFDDDDNDNDNSGNE